MAETTKTAPIGLLSFLVEQLDPGERSQYMCVPSNVLLHFLLPSPPQTWKAMAT